MALREIIAGNLDKLYAGMELGPVALFRVADLGLFTGNHEIARDVVNLFHYLTGRSVPPECHSLLVAPVTMRPRFLEMVEREIENRKGGRPARIVAKMNQLEDPKMIRALVEAAGAGVPVDLIVRGFCCLRPGEQGFTEGIRVRSIIGRFLEPLASTTSPRASRILQRASSSSGQQTGCSAISPAVLRSSRRFGIPH